MDVELREDNTSPHNGYYLHNFRARQFIVQDDRLFSGKSLSAQQLSYGKFRIGCPYMYRGRKMYVRRLYTAGKFDLAVKDVVYTWIFEQRMIFGRFSGFLPIVDLNPLTVKCSVDQVFVCVCVCVCVCVLLSF